MADEKPYHLKADGKFFRYQGDRCWIKKVTYGPFPPKKAQSLDHDFRQIVRAGFHSIRLYQLPDFALLNAAHAHGLTVFAGLEWNQYQDFIAQPSLVSAATIKLDQWLKSHSSHPAIVGIYVGNEIPATLVRWMGAHAVREVIESLIEIGKKTAPHLLFAYANYPSTEYLEPANADFTAFNIYLENQNALSAYLRRLHNIAGDRPLLISEFGIDSARNSLNTQAEVLKWALDTSYLEDTAGFTVYSYTDLWLNNGYEVLDWDFGLTDRFSKPKPAYEVCRNYTLPEFPPIHRTYSIAICTRNGGKRIRKCLSALLRMRTQALEIIVIDDGSSDNTANIVKNYFPSVHLISIPSAGLSAARNYAAEIAKGDIIAFTDDDCEPDLEWITRIDKAFLDPNVAAAGGPNLAPPPKNFIAAVTNAAPGSPSHVLLDDASAEHLPGCNMAVRKNVLNEIGGFDPLFQTAGDDVDFCWRLSDAGYRLAFVPGAFVWHDRRPNIVSYLKQQIGYGKAERLLLAKHPQRFSKNGQACWQGFIYSGGVITVNKESIIYHGIMGEAGYQSITNRMLPPRPIDHNFRSYRADYLLHLLAFFQKNLRMWYRNVRIELPIFYFKTSPAMSVVEFSIVAEKSITRVDYIKLLIANGWNACDTCSSWDLKKSDASILVAFESYGPDLNRFLFRVAGDKIDLTYLKKLLQSNLA